MMEILPSGTPSGGTAGRNAPWPPYLRKRPTPTTKGSSRVLGLAIAEGPVLLGNVDQRDEHVLTPQAQTRVQAISDGLVEGFLLLNRAACVQRQLDETQFL